jgi:hypothetical protein
MRSLNPMSSNSSTHNNFSIVYDAVDPRCKVGSVVAMNTDTGFIVPAIAGGSTILRSDGSEVPSDLSYVLGVVTARDSKTNTATICCWGEITDTNLINQIVGVGAPSGNYYLSADVEGTVELRAYEQNQFSPYCMTYLTATSANSPRTLFIRPQQPAYNGTPELRSLVVDGESRLLTVETNKGTAKLKFSAATSEEDVLRGEALVTVGNNAFKTAPVVNQVVAGAGITIDQLDSGNPGRFTISTTSALAQELDMNLCAMDGVYIGTTVNNAVVYTFPAGFTSSMTGVIRAPYLDEPVDGVINILVQGTEAGSVPTVLEVTVQDTVNAEGTAGIEAQALRYTITETDGMVPTSTVYKASVKLEPTQAITSNALVYVKLISVDPVNPAKVMAVSLSLNPRKYEDTSSDIVIEQTTE